MPEIKVTYTVRITKSQEVDPSATSVEDIEKAIIEDDMMEFHEAEFVELEKTGE